MIKNNTHCHADIQKSYQIISLSRRTTDSYQICQQVNKYVNNSLTHNWQLSNITISHQTHQWQLSALSMTVINHVTGSLQTHHQQRDDVHTETNHFVLASLSPPQKKKEKRRWVKDCSTRLLQFIFFQKKPDFKHYSQSSNIKTVWPDSSTLSPNPNQSSMTWIFYTRGMSQDWSTTEALCTN